MKGISAFQRSVRDGSLSRTYAFFGEEDFLKDETEEILRKRLEKESSSAAVDRIVFHCADCTPQEVEEACSYTSLFGGLRFIVLCEFEKWGSKDQKRFSSFIGSPGPSSGCVLLIRTTLRKFPVKVESVASHIFWKPFHRELVRWVEARLKNGGLGFSDDVPRLLIDRYAGEDVKSLRGLAGEIDKLILYSGKGGAITSSTVLRVCSDIPQAEFFRLLEAASKRRQRESLSLARSFFASDPSKAIGFVSLLSSRFSDFLVLRVAGGLAKEQWSELVRLCRRRLTPKLKRSERAGLDKEIAQLRGEIASLVPGGLKTPLTEGSPFVFATRCCESDGFSLDELTWAVSESAEAECRLKSGESDPLTELDTLLTRISVPGLLLRDFKAR